MRHALALICLGSVLVHTRIVGQPTDRLVPFISEHSRSHPDTLIYWISDTTTVDTGLYKISVRLNGDTASARVVIAPPIAPCSRAVHLVRIYQPHKESAGIEIKATDCAGNVASTGIIIDYFDPRDPLILSRVDSNTSIHAITVGDTGFYDSGISRIDFTEMDSSRFAVEIIPELTPCSNNLHTIVVRNLDEATSGCLQIIIYDCGQNRTVDSICFTGKQRVIPLESVMNLILVKQHTSILIRMVVEEPGEVILRLIDVAGRERNNWHHQLAAGLNEIPITTSNVPNGTYYIIAEFGGRQYAKKMQMVR